MQLNSLVLARQRTGRRSRVRLSVLLACAAVLAAAPAAGAWPDGSSNRAPTDEPVALTLEKTPEVAETEDLQAAPAGDSVESSEPDDVADLALGPTEPASDGPLHLLVAVFDNLASYWAEAGNAPAADAIGYAFVPAGESVETACRDGSGRPTRTSDATATYCPADAMIYISQELADRLTKGEPVGLPGEEAGYGQGIGDFGVASTVAHEYGHAVQDFRGIFELDLSIMAEELQADCFAGIWANAAEHAGLVEPGDISEAVSTVLATGDFSPEDDSHGTPEQRLDAWLLGYSSGDALRCDEYIAESAE